MGKVISFEDHIVKGDWMTTGQHIAMFHYSKWKGVQWRRWIAAQKAESDKNKPRLVPPK